MRSLVLFFYLVSQLVWAGPSITSNVPENEAADAGFFSHTQGLCEPFKNRNVSIIVGFKAGGGFDRTMREFASVLERISGMDVRVVNKPGGGSLGVINQMTSKGRGEFRIGYLPLESLVVESLMAEKIAELEELVVFGQVFDDVGVWMAGRPVDWTNPPSDLVAGLTSSAMRNIGLVAETMALPVSYVHGIKGSNQVALSLARGDIDLAYLSLDSAMRLKTSFPDLYISLLIDHSADPRLPETPHLAGPGGIVSITGTSGSSPDQIDLAELAVALGGSTRSLIAEGSLSASEQQCLSASVNAALFDPAFELAMAQQKLGYAPQRSEDVEQSFKKMLFLVEKHHDVLIDISNQ